MKSFFCCLGILFLVVSCAEGDKGLRMEVHGNVKGLKKGVLYLQVIPDSTLVNVDSVEIRGNGEFTFTTPVTEPDIYYIYLDNADNNSLDDRISFFGEPGKYEITTNWDGFETDAEIKGTPDQEKYLEFKNTMSRFNLRQLELSRAMIGLQYPGDSTALDSLEHAVDRSLRRKYLYTLNFAHSHKGSYLAPYVAWSEIADANPILLDSLYNNLPDSIANSKYGKKLKGLLE